MIKPVLLYGYETWILTSALEKSIERKVLRTITGAIWDPSTNELRRTEKELLMETAQSISHEMMARRLRWAGHVA